MSLVLNKKFLGIFFGVAACSWMPHWACHYYRLETNSTFVVGSWAFSVVDSTISLLIYSVLIAINLVSISVEKYRIIAATITGIGHLSLGLLHVYRLLRPFTFEVFGYSWSYGASLREVMMVVPFGLFSLFVAWLLQSK